jgi:hypothetical protein
MEWSLIIGDKERITSFEPLTLNRTLKLMNNPNKKEIPTPSTTCLHRKQHFGITGVIRFSYDEICFR